MNLWLKGSGKPGTTDVAMSSNEVLVAGNHRTLAVATHLIVRDIHTAESYTVVAGIRSVRTLAIERMKVVVANRRLEHSRPDYSRIGLRCYQLDKAQLVHSSKSHTEQGTRSEWEARSFGDCTAVPGSVEPEHNRPAHIQAVQDTLAIADRHSARVHHGHTASHTAAPVADPAGSFAHSLAAVPAVRPDCRGRGSLAGVAAVEEVEAAAARTDCKTSSPI